MQPTDLELAAARRFAESLVHLIVAIQHGHATRHPVRPQTDVRQPVPPPVQQPWSPPVRQPPQPPPTPGLINTREAAEYLGISPRTLFGLMAPNGPIAVVRIGRVVRFRRTDLDQWIDRQRTTKRKDSPT